MTFGTLRHLSTLLVDDDEFVRDSIRLMFESRHCRVRTVETAEEALEVLCVQNYDIVIADYKLPGMDGLELCKTLYNNNLCQMTILITAYGSSALEAAAAGVGVSELIEKPITFEAIESSLSRLLARPG